ncbi:hypothetical protein [Candidatus Nitrosocosmicus arcticus]|uniref:4Fe-4S ferredoxin iron-sulfur binding domain protein n=1 Tax=Candidatus Nitrosocosmicus arcticus TaxID=2035267 RepID=A0A557SSM5_9ARCH|nr:hypothetical protein [Candidatus Nitrosocosmicus arcticus]TVP39611.1 4Fe-4S ferredoxin iron-sulfur binding domain protein [Candidatus Nitrosocosmicus arcticus]
MDNDPLLAPDWIKMNMRFPGLCLICKQRVNSAEVGYWSRTAKSIIHQDCYNLSGLYAKKNQNSFKNKTIQSQKNGDSLLAEFITDRESKEKCFICSKEINFQDDLIMTLLKLERNISTLDTLFCSTCLSCSDLHIFEEYKHAFSNKIKSL